MADAGDDAMELDDQNEGGGGRITLDMLGGTCGNEAIDHLARYVGLELFVRSEGVRMLARGLIMRAMNRPIEPNLTASICDVLQHVLELGRAKTDRFGLSVTTYDELTGAAIWRFDRQRTRNSVFLHTADMVDSGRKTLLKELAVLVAPGMKAFFRRNHGLRTRLTLINFRADAILAHFFDHVYLCHAMMEFVFCTFVGQLVFFEGRGNPLLRDLCRRLALFFAAVPEPALRAFAHPLEEMADGYRETIAHYFQATAKVMYERANSLSLAALQCLRHVQRVSWGQGRARKAVITAAAIGEDEDEEKRVAT